ncbi:TNF receptor-associated factor 6-B-like [Stylophora pistillata]|uniref:TNF receptor-associated factor 6-B-like n=1 Tax=Stylophora pistillata TaxID=50429 RepID=UPI000C048377|nr:TNF receptor-associated factor 6-B-like [Stylophora pistillata]
MHYFALVQQYFEDAYVRREILQIVTPCLDKDASCEWIGEVRNAEDHYKERICRPVTCSNAGCSENVPLSTLAQHQEEECQFRDVVCNSCNMAVKWADQAV